MHFQQHNTALLYDISEHVYETEKHAIVDFKMF
jgi:hypothetical protein